MANLLRPTSDLIVHRGVFGAGRVLAAFLLSLALVASVAIAARAYRAARTDSTVVVRGSMKREIVADRIVWRTDVSATAATLTEASTQLEKHMAAVNAYMDEKGIAAAGETRLVVEPINTEKQYVRDQNGNPTGPVMGYALTQQVRVESSEVDAIEAASKEVTKLLGQGIELSTYAPEYVYTKAADLRVELLEKAAQDGKRRAETLARNAGGTLGALQQARMGVFQILPQYSVDVEDYGANDTSSKRKDAMAVVTLTYELED